MTDIQFIDGLIVKSPGDKAPDFIKAKISIKREALIADLQGREEDWINLDVKVAKSGKWYAAINTWKKEDAPERKPNEVHDGLVAHGGVIEEDLSDIPF